MDARNQPHCGSAETQRIISMKIYFLYAKKYNGFNVVFKKGVLI